MRDWIDTIKADRDRGVNRALDQRQHAAVNARYPGCTASAVANAMPRLAALDDMTTAFSSKRRMAKSVRRAWTAPRNWRETAIAEPTTLALSQALADKMMDALADGMRHEHIAAAITNAAALFIAATAHQRPGIAFSAARDIANALPKLVATLVAQAQRDTEGAQ